MIAVLSPAKTLDYATPLPPIAATEPRFADKADELARAAAKLSARRVGELMHISPKLAKLNIERFRGFAQAEARPALYAFAGDVYTGFEARSLDEDGVRFAQGHVRVLSGLYGLLRPADAIRPYRLEMGTRWAPGRPKDLYDWWQGRVADLLAADLAEEGSATVLNLASREYWGVVEGRLPAGVRVIEVDFRDPGPAGPRFIAFNAKKARGAMARWMCEHRVTRAEDMKGCDAEGYRFDARESTPDRWRFARA